MPAFPKTTLDGKAIVYAEHAFNSTEGKTANGLVRFTQRYEIVGVIDSDYSGQDAGMVLDGRPNGILVYSSLQTALSSLSKESQPQKLVLGIAPDGGKLPPEARACVVQALEHGLGIDNGLHDLLGEDPELKALAAKHNCVIRDIRKTPSRDQLHFFSGEITKIDCLRIAVLGTDSAVGKRTSAWLIVQGLESSGIKSVFVGTGQTAWLQGARYSMILDSCINDYVSGEIEHQICQAWKNERPDVIVIEGQGSLMHPAYPSGCEILASGQPHFVILQHSPKRTFHDGFPSFEIAPLKKQIQAIELLLGRKVLAITLNHEDMKEGEIQAFCHSIFKSTQIPTFEILTQGTHGILKLIKQHLK